MTYSVRIRAKTDFYRDLIIAQGLETLETAAQIGQAVLAIPGTGISSFEIWETTDQHDLRFITHQKRPGIAANRSES